MNAANRDPLTIAREVLETAHEDDTITVCTIPDNKAAALARAVVELTAERDAYREENTRFREQAARVKALADRLDHEAEARRAARQDPLEVLTIRQEAARIRAELNGENR